MNPVEDPSVRNIKIIATKGGENGPHFDRGVLDTIAVLERDGSFVKNKMIGIFIGMKMQQTGGAQILTDDEVESGKQFMLANGFNFDQAFQYWDGVDFVQRNLFQYEKREKKSK